MQSQANQLIGVKEEFTKYRKMQAWVGHFAPAFDGVPDDIAKRVRRWHHHFPSSPMDHVQFNEDYTQVRRWAILKGLSSGDSPPQPQPRKQTMQTIREKV